MDRPKFGRSATLNRGINYARTVVLGLSDDRVLDRIFQPIIARIPVVLLVLTEVFLCPGGG